MSEGDRCRLPVSRSPGQGEARDGADLVFPSGRQPVGLREILLVDPVRHPVPGDAPVVAQHAERGSFSRGERGDRDRADPDGPGQMEAIGLVLDDAGQGRVVGLHDDRRGSPEARHGEDVSRLRQAQHRVAVGRGHGERGFLLPSREALPHPVFADEQRTPVQVVDVPSQGGRVVRRVVEVPQGCKSPGSPVARSAEGQRARRVGSDLAQDGERVRAVEAEGARDHGELPLLGEEIGEPRLGDFRGVRSGAQRDRGREREGSPRVQPVPTVLEAERAGLADRDGAELEAVEEDRDSSGHSYSPRS